MIQLLHKIYIIFIFAPIAAVLTLGTLLLVCITSPISKKFAMQLWVRYWGRIFCAITPVHVKRTGLDNIVPGQSYVVVANHASQYDIPLVAGWVSMDLKWVAKMELRSNPIVGTAGKAIDAIFVDRGNTEAAIKSIEAAKSKLVGGTSIIFFPEGTRSKIGKMLPFKRGAFVMAKDLGLPVLPISIVDSDKIMPSGTMLPNAASVELRVHPPIDAQTVADMPVLELSKHARDVVGSALPSES